MCCYDFNPLLFVAYSCRSLNVIGNMMKQMIHARFENNNKMSEKYL